MCVSRSRIVIGRLAGTIVDAAVVLRTATVVFANAGMNRLTGSLSADLPFLDQRQDRDARDRLGLRRDAEDRVGRHAAGRLPCRSSRPRARRPACRRAARAPRRRRCGSRPRTAAAAVDAREALGRKPAFRRHDRALGAPIASTGAVCPASTTVPSTSSESGEHASSVVLHD